MGCKPSICQSYILHNEQVWTCPRGEVMSLYIDVQVEEIWTCSCLRGSWGKESQLTGQSWEGAKLGPGGPCMVRSNAWWVMITWETPVDKMVDWDNWKHYFPANWLTGANEPNAHKRYAAVARDNGTHSLLIVGSNVAILSRYNRPDFCYWIKPRGQQRPFVCKKEFGIFINIFETI